MRELYFIPILLAGLLLSGCETTSPRNASSGAGGNANTLSPENMVNFEEGAIGSLKLGKGLMRERVLATLGEPWKRIERDLKGAKVETLVYRSLLDESASTEIVDYTELDYVGPSGSRSIIREPVYGDVIIRTYKISELTFRNDELLTWNQYATQDKRF